MIKLCKNCKHYRRNWMLGPELADCNHPNNLEMSLVSGKVLTKHFCTTLRRNTDRKYCGPKGSWFESK